MAVRMMLEAIDAHEAEATAPESTAESRALRRIRLGPLLELEEPLARTLGMSADGRGVSALSSPASGSTVSFDSTASVQSSVCSTSSLSAPSTIARIVPHRFKRASALLSTRIDELVGEQLNLVKHQSERGTIIGNFADAIAVCVDVAVARLSVSRLRDDFERLSLSAAIDASTRRSTCATLSTCRASLSRRSLSLAAVHALALSFTMAGDALRDLGNKITSALAPVRALTLLEVLTRAAAPAVAPGARGRRRFHPGRPRPPP